MPTAVRHVAVVHVGEMPQAHFGIAPVAAVVGAIEKALLAVISTRPLDEVLVTALDCCTTAADCLYPSIALLDERDGSLVGRVICSPHTSESAKLAAASIGLTSHSFLGGSPEACESPSYSSGSAASVRAISYLLYAENLVVRAFVDRTPRTSLSYHDLLRPQLATSDAVAMQRALGVGSIAILPLLAGGRCMGVLGAGSAAHAITGHWLQLLNIFAGLAAAGVRYARVRQELRDRERQVSLLLKTTIDAQEEERERICLEIHDGVAQTLAPAFQYLQTLENRPQLSAELRTTFRKAATLVRTAIHEAREVIATLRPAALDTLGLVATLRYELDEARAQTGWRIEFDADETRFPKPVETALYRIIHEAISNITKHARAGRVWLRLRQEQDRIVVEVRDDGLGFDPAPLERRVVRKGVGLLSMRKRAELLQGSFELVSTPGNGTLVRVRVPLSVGTDEGSNADWDE